MHPLAPSPPPPLLLPCDTAPVLIRQISAAKCVANITFGCTGDGRSVWVTAGCRGLFSLPRSTSSSSTTTTCGYPGDRTLDTRSRLECSLIHGSRSFASLSSPPPGCECQNDGFGWWDRSPRWCRPPLHDDSFACSGMASGKSLGSCCAYDHKRGCSNKSNDFEACSWQGDTRIAWLHVPKTGTSFLLALALMANRSLATHIESGKMMREMMYNAGVQWQGLF